jgi:hypothetical protein
LKISEAIMETAAIKKQVKEWKRYSEPPAKINRMIADRVTAWLNEYRQKNTEYLTNQLKNIRTIEQALAAKCTYIDPDTVSKSSLRYAALPVARLKAETPKDYTEALVLARELRARGADVEADRAAMRAEVLSMEYLYDQTFQEVLGDAMTREGVLMAPGLIPTIPLDQITAGNVRNKQVGFIPVDDFVKEIVEGDVQSYKAVMALIEKDAAPSHLPQSLKNEYYELGKLRVQLPATLEDFTAGWDPDRKAEFMETLPETLLEKYGKPNPIQTAAKDHPTDPAHDAAIGDIARKIIADERGRLQKEIADLHDTAGGST